MENNIPGQKLSFTERFNISPVMFGILALVAIFVTYQIIGSIIAMLVMGSDVKSADPNLVRVTAAMGQLLFLLLPTFLIAKLLPENYREIFKLNTISLKLSFLIVISVFALMEIAQIILLLQSQIPIPEEIQNVLLEIKRAMEEAYKLLLNAAGYNELALVILIIAIIPAVSEEFFFRGLLQHNFVKGVGAKSGIILTGTFFALFHFNPFSLLALLVLGIYFSFLVYKTNSIYSSILGHFTNNFVAALSFYFFGKDDLVLDSTEGIIATSQLPSIFMVFILSLSIFIVALNLIYKETKN